MSTSCYWNINTVNKLHQEDTTLNPYEIRIGLSVLNDKLLDYFKNDSDALAKTDKIINNLSAKQFRSYMNEINSGRKDAYLDFIKGAKKSKIDFNKKEFVQGKQFQKLTEEEKAKTIEQVTKENRSITSLKDLSAKLAHRIGGKVTFENNPNADWKGYNQGMTSVLNEAYMTPDTPFHEILAHPIIRAIKYVNANNQKTNEFLKSFKLNNSEFIDESDIGEGYFKDGKRISEEEFNKAIDEYSKITPLYQSLLKELETGKGKEVFEQVKRDYKYKDDKFKFNIDDYSEYLRLQQDTNYDGGSDDLLYYHYDNLKIIPTDDIKTINYLKKQGYKEIDYIKNNKSTLSNYSGYVYTPTKESYFVYIKDTNSKYTLEEQQEEAIVTLLGMMAADKLDAKKDATLISKLKELWEQISDFIKSLLKQDGIKIDELPITTTLNDLAEIMGYGNNKIILPGYKVEYSTPLGNKYDTLEEVNNEIRGLADADVEVDFSSIDIITFEDYQKDKKAINNLELRHGKFLVKKNLLGKETVYFKSNERKEAPFKVGDSFVKNWLEDGNYLNENLRSFIEKNKKYEQSREIIEQWKKENNIQYDPEEVYSRGQGFYSSIGAYSNLELDLLLKNLIQHIQDNKKAGGEFTISAFTKPIDKRVKHIEGTGDRVRFVIYPKSEHIKWAAPTDVYSGSVWDAHKKVSKDKKSELLGVSFTKAPDLININAVSPNLADIIDNLSHAHNELGIELTTNNFRLEYDDNIDYSTKKLIDNINKILDDKYGKLVKPEIKKPERKQVGYSLILDFNDGEISIIEDFKTEEEANNALIEQRKIQTREDLEQGYELKVLPKIEQGKQPTQTKENTTNIESVKSKLDKENYEKFGRQEAEEGMEFIYPEEHNKKEYTSQAEINLKVAALKEVARKYPRSLITSKVVPINPNMADNSEIQYSKVGSKQDIDGFKDFVNNKPVTSPSLTSKIEEVKKAYLDFSYQTRLDRVSMLTNMFSNKVTELLEQESPEGTYTLEELQENPELANKLKYKANPSKRKDIIALQNLDDNNVFNLVKKDLIAFINTSEEDLKVQEFNRFKNIPLYSDLSSVETDYILPHFIQVKKREYQKVLDNWNVLIEDVIRKVSFIEGITVKFDNTAREANVIEEQDDNPDVESIKEDDDHQESNVKDAIFANILEQAPILNLAPEIRRILSSVPLLDNNKNIVYDDLGYKKYINFSTVYEEILQQLSKGMLDSNELIPELEKLVVGKPWVQGVIDLLNESPEFKTKLFTNSFKDSKEYLAIVSSEEKDDAGSKIISLNSSEAAELFYNNWRSNYASGYPLTKNTVYNTSGKLIIPNIEENKNRLATLHSKLIKSKQNELLDNILLDDNIKELLNLIKALGINLDENTLRNMLTYSTSDKWTSESFNTIIGKLSLIYSGLFNDLKNERNQNTVGYDLISHYKTAFKEIAKLVTKVDNAFFLSNVREGRKTYYSYTGASMLGSFVKILSGKTNKQEVKEWVDLFKSDEWYYNEKKKLWNISWLNDLVNPETYEILPDAKEFSNSLLLHNNKREYKNYTDNVHIHSVLQLYKGKKGENSNFGYYELPTLADSGRQEVIRFKKYTDNYEEILLEKFADIVYMEINRIKKIRERYRRFNLKPNEQGYLNPDLHRIKNYDIVNKDNVGGARFLFIPELNSPEYANLLDQVPDELASAKVIEIKNIIKKILDNRFEDFMMQYAKKGLFKANEKGGYAHLPYLGNREAHNKFTLSQLNSALSKLRNIDIKEINDLKTALNNNWYVPEQKVKDIFDLVNTMLQSQNSSHPLLTYTDTITNNIKEFYWNHAFASTQMIMLFAKDLAFYDGTEDFVKRFKEVIGGGQKFDTNAEYEGEKVGITHQNLIYIKDVKVKSNIYESIEHILQERVNKKYFTKQEFSDTMEQFKSMSLTDSQGLKNLDTRRIEEIMLGNWEPELQQAYNHFKEGTWSKLDIDVVLNSNKFFAYGPVKYNNENDKSEVIFTQVKNSEMVMLLMGVQKTNPVLRVLNRILDESQGMLQGFQFDSAIKTGTFGAITLDINLNEQELYESLKNQIYDSKTNQLRNGIVHSIPYKYTVMQQNTPAHHKDTTIPIGTQMRFITMQDTDPNRMHSYQGKLYTTEEIKLLYNAINVQNILNSLREVDEIFKDGENIEKELQSLMQDRNLYTQEFADGLRWDKENNQFRIPLYEQSHCTKVEYLLNSIIKNKIVKQKIKGGTLYQITNIGKQNDLNVRFYDKNNNLIERNDKKTKPHRVAYVEAYLSVYDSRFESYRRFLNNDGTININKIPTELLNIVAYRVPSEGAYSIFPIRVVGFTDSVSQGIMLPTDLLQISGFDFDIDKLFFFAKEFFFDKENKLIIPKIRINGKNREDIIQSVTNQGSSKAALDNTFIDLLLEQMTSPEYTAKFFEPGSVKKLERIADILQVTEFYTEKELLKLFPGTNSIEQTLINLSSKELRELIKNKKQLSSPIFFEETLRSRKEVMSGASLISRFALTNSAHAKLNDLGIEILKNQVIKLNGKELYILDPSTVESDEKIEFISRIIASFISSAVDNTKNPILGKLNANETTVNYITYLLRLGYNPMEVLLFMSQPIIKDFVNTAESDNNSNTPHKYIFQDVLQRYEDKFKKLTTLEDIDRLSISKIDINDDLMLNSLLNAKTVRKNEVLLQNQLAIGYMFQKILPVAEMNKNLTLILRGDTTAFAGGKISNVKARELAIERFKIANQETGFLMGANDLITNLFPEHKTLTLNLLLEQKLPIVQAFTNGALFKTKELLKNYFPQYKPGYEDLISNISNMTKSGILSEYVLTELFFHSMIYFLQNNPLFGDEYLPKIKQVIPAVDKRAYYYFGFMKDWKKTVENNPELSKLEFINRFTYTPLEFAGYNKIAFKNSGKITGALRELYELEQNILMSTKKGKTLLTELFQYEYFTNGLKFSNDGFSHLFTTFLKEQLDTVIGTDQNISPTYLETVRSILTLAEDFSGKEEFLHQFIQNHPKLTALVQSADNTTYKNSFIDPDGNIRETIDISLTDLKGKNRILLKDHLLYDDELSTLQNALHDYISFDNGRILYRKTSLSSEKYNHVTYENVSILSSLEYEIGRDVQTALTQEMRNKYDPIKTKSTVSRNGFDKITENDDPYHNRNHYNDEITIENSTKKDAPNVKQLDLFAELPSNNFKDANNEFPC